MQRSAERRRESVCANSVKDSQRSKTHDDTRRTLCIVWGTQALAERSTAALAWYRQLHERAGPSLSPCALDTDA